MNKTRKILFFDIDGTLITDDGKRYFPDSAKEAIQKARENGHLAFINTGRVFCNVTEEIRSAGFDGFVCGCGIHIVYNGETLFHHVTPYDVCAGVIRKCREYKMDAVYEHADKVFTSAAFSDNEHLKELISYFKATSTYMEYDDPANDHIFDKFCAWYDADTPYLEVFKTYLEKDYMYIQREGNFCEVVPKGYTKATGIRYLLDYFDLPLENAYAFGDGSNDEPMLAYVPNSIIMKKGPEYLKKKVRLVTDDVREDGIYKAMKKMEII